MSTVYFPQTTRPYRREPEIELEPAFPPGMPGLTSYVGPSSAATLAADFGDVLEFTPEHRAKMAATKHAKTIALRAARGLDLIDDQIELFCHCGCGETVPRPTVKSSNRPVPRYIHGHNRRTDRIAYKQARASNPPRQQTPEETERRLRIKRAAQQRRSSVRRDLADRRAMFGPHDNPSTSVALFNAIRRGEQLPLLGEASA